MIPRFAAMFFALVVWVGVAHAADSGNQQLAQFFAFESGGTEYTVATVIQSPGPLAGPAGSKPGQEFVRKLFEQAQAWNVHEYSTRYPSLPREFFERMFAQSPLLDDHSAYVLIFEGRDLNKVAAMIRFAAPDRESGLLPSEKLFGLTIPKEPVSNGPYPFGETVWNKELGASKELARDAQYGWMTTASWFHGGNLATAQRESGGSWEIKNFVAAKGAEHDLIPMMYFIAEKLGLSHSIYGDIYNPKIGIAEKRPPASYLVFCDEVLVPYYQKLGFRLVNDSPVRGRNYALRISRSDFLNRVSSALTPRPGVDLLKDGRWNFLGDSDKFLENWAALPPPPQAPSACEKNLRQILKTLTH